MPHSPRRAITLIEMLVALAVTLVMMAAVVNLFANISGSIRNRRAVIEVSGQLRQVRSRLALDLAGATCKGQTWQRPENDPGYIEIIEGEYSDAFPSILVDGVPPATDYREIDYATSLVPSGGDVTTDLTYTNPPLTTRRPQPGDVTNGLALGDWDDILALTVQSEAQPFKAQVGGNMIETTFAEVIWFAGENPQDDPTTPDDETITIINGTRTRYEPGMRRIYRRVFLIAPWLGPWNYDATQNDRGRPQNVSVRFVPGSAPDTGQWVANTLGDLTKRENRAYRAYDASIPATSLFPHILSNLSSEDEFLVLPDALAFDVRVFDPGAPIRRSPPPPASGPDVPFTALQPGDPGWAAAPPNQLVGFGAYTDLGWDPGGSYSWSAYVATLPAGSPQPPQPVFQLPHRVGWHPYFLRLAPSAQPLIGFPAMYDTWSYHYENDGIDQETVLETFYNGVTPRPSPPPRFNEPWQKNLSDQGANGLDDDNINGVDDPGERETAPPYDFPLRGVKVSLRIYEPDARQIRETSVTHSFAK